MAFQPTAATHQALHHFSITRATTGLISSSFLEAGRRREWLAWNYSTETRTPERQVPWLALQRDLSQEQLLESSLTLLIIICEVG